MAQREAAVRIGFDVSQTGNAKAGCGYVADSLIRALEQINPAHDFLLYTAVGDLFWDPNYRRGTFHPSSARMERRLSPRDFPESQQFWRCPKSDFETVLGAPDIVHIHNFYAPHGLAHARLAWTLHDLDFLVHPEWSDEANRTGCFQGALGAARRADLIVAVSEYSRRQFLEVFPHYPAERIAVVPLASRFTSVPKERPAQLPALVPGSFWLSVATMQPRKNLSRLIRAWARLRRRDPSTPALVLTGGEGWLMDDIRRTCDLQGSTDDLIVTGYVDDVSLAWLYGNCFAFAFVALAEGFGLPVVEAMSLGAPVMCSDTTSIPEVAGGAAMLTDPWDESAIEESMNRMQHEPGLRARLRDLGRTRAAAFSWRKSAHRLLELYEECIARPKYAVTPAGITSSKL